MEDLKKYLRDNVGKSVRPEVKKEVVKKKTTTKSSGSKRTDLTEITPDPRKGDGHIDKDGKNISVQKKSKINKSTKSK